MFSYITVNAFSVEEVEVIFFFFKVSTQSFRDFKVAVCKILYILVYGLNM